MLPRRREEDLIVRPLSDETLVYDSRIDRAHCLNPTAAAIWKHCDGRTSVLQLAAMLRRECRIPANDAVVWLALRQLQQARLLRERVQAPSGVRRLSRRELIRTLGTAAAIPIVMTIVAPTAMAQASDTCTGQRGLCNSRTCPGSLRCRQVGPDMACGCVTD